MVLDVAQIVCVVPGLMVIVWAIDIFCVVFIFSWFVFIAYVHRCGKWISACVTSITALLFRRNESPIIGVVTYCRMMKHSVKGLSPTSNVFVTLASGCSSCPVATWTWKFGGGLSFLMLFGAICLIWLWCFRDRTLIKAPKSTSASMDICWKSRGMNSILCFFFRGIVVEIGM